MTKRPKKPTKIVSMETEFKSNLDKKKGRRSTSKTKILEKQAVLDNDRRIS